MTLVDIWAEYKENTTKLSEIGRNLAFGGAAVCWFFKTPEATFPVLILLSLLAIVLYFVCDVLQHFVSAVTLRFWAKRQQKEILKRKGRLEDETVYKPNWLPIVPFGLFTSKIGLLFTAFFFLCSEFLVRLIRA